MKVLLMKQNHDSYSRQTMSPTLEVVRCEPRSSFFDSPEHNLRIRVTTADGYAFIPLSEIRAIQASGSYVQLYGMNGELYTESRTLAYFESRLPSGGFLRVHQSWAVNIKHIRSICTKSDPGLTLSEGLFVPISRRQLKKVKTYLIQNISI